MKIYENDFLTSETFSKFHLHRYEKVYNENRGVYNGVRK